MTSVFLCNCGSEISKVVDTAKVAAAIEAKEGAGLVSVHNHLCDQHSLKRMKRLIMDSGAENVVVSACSPELHEETFSRVLSSAGLSPSRLKMVNVREHCAWVHRDKEAATDKAIALTCGALAKSKYLDDIVVEEVRIEKRTLVIGAGVAGTNAALELAKKGIETYLLEEKPWIGGVTAQVGMAFPTDDCAYCIGARSERAGVRKCFYRADLMHHPNLKIITNAELKSLEGSVGNFTVKIEKKADLINEDCISCSICEEVCPIEVADPFNRGLTQRKAIYKQFEAVPNKYVIDFEACTVCKKCEEACPERAIDFSQRAENITLNVGSVVIATGIEEFDPTKVSRYGYKKHDNVLTQLDLARYLDPAGPTAGELALGGEVPKSIVMIQCVGSREKDFNAYCSRLCCMMAIKHAIAIKKRYPGVEVAICYIDIRTTGDGYEDWYTKALELGVVFIQGKPSEVINKGETSIVRVESANGEELNIRADLVVLSAGIESSQKTRETAALMGLELNKDGFIKVLDPKVRGVDTDRWGVFVCGGAKGPTDIPESIMQASAAASKVSSLLLRDKLINKRNYPLVDVELCDGCEVCQEKCGFAAVSVDPVACKAVVNRGSCHGCGVCSANCPSSAIQLLGFTDDGIFAEMEGILASNPTREKIIGFICSECGYASSDLAGVERFTYPESIHLIDLPCLGRLSSVHILKAFEKGAAGVALVGCMPGRCQHNSGTSAKDNLELAKEVLRSIGRGSDLALYNFCGAKSHDFAHAMNEFANKRVKQETLNVEEVC